MSTQYKLLNYTKKPRCVEYTKTILQSKCLCQKSILTPPIQHTKRSVKTKKKKKNNRHSDCFHTYIAPVKGKNSQNSVCGYNINSSRCYKDRKRTYCHPSSTCTPIDWNLASGGVSSRGTSWIQSTLEEIKSEIKKTKEKQTNKQKNMKGFK